MKRLPKTELVVRPKEQMKIEELGQASKMLLVSRVRGPRRQLVRKRSMKPLEGNLKMAQKGLCRKQMGV